MICPIDKDAVVRRLMHPWERDARLFKEALVKKPQQINIILEVACTRSAEELLGARRAYHSLFKRSVEEDIFSHFHGVELKVDRHMSSWFFDEFPKFDK